MQLRDAKVGQSYIVQELSLPAPLERRLEALGMTHNTKISIITAKGEGIMVIKLRGSRFALGANITKNITVSPIQ